MKKVYLFILLLLPFYLPAQSILNGSFETNVVFDDSLGLTEPSFDNSVSYCHTVDGGMMDVISSTAYCGGAQDGSYFIQNSAFEYYGAFSMELSSPLVPGNSYHVEFWSRQCGGAGNVILGESLYDSIIGTPFLTSWTEYDTVWSLHVINFTATMASTVITVDMPNPGLNSQMQVDNFSLISISTSVDEAQVHEIKVGPNPVSGICRIQTDEQATFSLFDQAGRLVKTLSLHSGTTDMAVSDLGSGLYFWKSATSADRYNHGKLVVL